MRPSFRQRRTFRTPAAASTRRVNLADAQMVNGQGYRPGQSSIFRRPGISEEER
jgi:hypothetical protein